MPLNNNGIRRIVLLIAILALGPGLHACGDSEDTGTVTAEDIGTDTKPEDGTSDAGDGVVGPDGDATVAPDGDAVVDPDADATVDPDADVVVDPDADVVVDPDADATVDPDADATVDPDADDVVDPDVPVNPCDPNPCTAGEGQDFTCEDLVSTEWENTGECVPDGDGVGYTCTPKVKTTIDCGDIANCASDEEGDDCYEYPGQAECYEAYCQAQIGCKWIDNQSCKVDPCEEAGLDCTGGFGGIDGNPCTNDKCVVDDGVASCDSSEIINCDDANGCTVDSCDESIGCVNEAGEGCVSCFEDEECDGQSDACSAGKCDTLTGTCIFDEAVVCDDDNPCSEDLCDPDHEPTFCGSDDDCAGSTCTEDGICEGSDDPCYHQGVPNCPSSCKFSFECDDWNGCTDNFCQKENPADIFGDCVYPPKDCDDGSECTVDGCDDTTGKCVYAEASCEDLNPCTIDSCGAGECKHEPVNCNDNDPTTEDFCLEFDGSCINKVKECPTEDPCLLGSPHPITGDCEYELKNNIPEAEGGCDDGNGCTEDVCYPENGACVHLAKDCDDDDPCTEPYCDADKGGCLYPQKDCSDDDLCNIDSCNPSDGTCLHAPQDFNDFNLCTEDGCDPTTGAPAYTDLDCDDGDGCTIDSCLSFSGCKHTDVDCNDFDACTQDTCLNESDGVNDYTCNNDVGTCDDGNPCTIDSCDATGACAHVQRESLTVADGGCIDDDVCTTSTCDAVWMEAAEEQAGSCLNTETPCFTDEECDVGDGSVIPCVGVLPAVPAHWAGTGECTNSNPCADEDPCTVDACAPVGDGVNFNCPGGDPVECADDGNACTIDLCDQDQGCYAPEFCDDLSPCTIDYCDDATGCVHEGADCDDGNPCTIDTCGADGCENVLMICNDDNPCTLDSCSIEGDEAQGVVAGECIYEAIDCDDDNACTIDQCFQEEVNVSNCEELGGDTLCLAVASTEELALPPGVCLFQDYSALFCGDNQVCTQDECLNEPDLDTGKFYSCENLPVDCDDGNACTDESCEPGFGCQFSLKSCDDGQACTIDGCDPEVGCTFEQNDCDDGNECTIDSCDPATGVCGTQDVDCHDQLGIPDTNLCIIVGCDAFKGCESQGACDDLNACTSQDGTPGGEDGCDLATGECTDTQPIICDDGLVCTVDLCNAQIGCTTVPKCLDGNECTIEECNEETGSCSQSDKDCDDGNPCTLDGCEPETGECTHEEIICQPDTVCFEATCNPENGLCEQSSFCNDGDTCTLDYCDEDDLDAEGLPACDYEAIECDDDNECTIDTCEAELDDEGEAIAGEFDCIHSLKTAEDCDDNEFCTIDYCDLIVGDCVHEPNICDDDNECTIDFCESGACDHVVNSFLVCDQQEGCDGGVQFGEPVCVVPCFDASDCDDGNLCTIDTCDPEQGICVNEEKCAIENPDKCKLWGCNLDDGQCYDEDLECASDANPCTDDYCNPAVGCTYAPIQCIPGDLCDVGACNVDTGECVFGPAECDDNDPCTTDACDPNTGACVFQVTDCDDGTICTVDICDPDTGLCVYEEEDCGGSDACAEAYCDPTEGCLVTPQIDCSDDDPCTEEKCDTVLGCISPSTCDDDDPCTIDYCDAEDLNAEGEPACSGEFDDCDDGDPCTYDFCQPGEGCVNNVIASCNQACVSDAECNDAEECTADACTDDGAGGGECTYSDSSICDDEEECTFDTCVPGLGCLNLLILGCGQLCTVDDDCTDTGICNLVFCQPIGDGSAAICKEEPIDCNDDDPCTLDQCDDTANPPGCTQNDIEECGDPFPCEEVTTCETDWPPAQSDQQSPCVKPHCGDDGFCTLVVGGCDDGDPCTQDSCNPQGTACEYTLIEGCEN